MVSAKESYGHLELVTGKFFALPTNVNVRATDVSVQLNKTEEERRNGLRRRAHDPVLSTSSCPVHACMIFRESHAVKLDSTVTPLCREADKQTPPSHDHINHF